MFPLTYINWHGALCPLSLRGTHSNAWGRGVASLPLSRRRVQVLPPFLIQYCSPPSLFYVYFYFHQLFVCCLSLLPDKKHNVIFGKWSSCATGKYIYIKMCKTCNQYLCTLLCKGALLLTVEGQSPKTRWEHRQGLETEGPSPGPARAVLGLAAQVLSEVPRAPKAGLGLLRPIPPCPKGACPSPALPTLAQDPPPLRTSGHPSALEVSLLPGPLSLLRLRRPRTVRGPRGRWQPLTAGAREGDPRYSQARQRRPGRQLRQGGGWRRAGCRGFGSRAHLWKAAEEKVCWNHCWPGGARKKRFIAVWVKARRDCL